VAERAAATDLRNKIPLKCHELDNPAGLCGVSPMGRSFLEYLVSAAALSGTAIPLADAKT